MQEIRFHGRGGQGTVLASVILAKAFFKAGYEVQTFPLFGVERRGAPVEAYLRLDDKKILIRSNVYTPDDLVVLDAKLLQTADVTKGLKPGGRVLINSPGIPEHPKLFSDYRVATVDAAQIALKYHLGTRTHPIINTAMIGAFARIMGMASAEGVAEAIEKEIPVKTAQNADAAREAYKEVRFF